MTFFGADQSKRIITCLIGAALSACVRVPAADPIASGPSVEDIVARVKCDLELAVVPELDQEKYVWLQNWTAQVSLNFSVNDQSSLNPGAVITNPLPLATIPGKVTNFTQSFSIGLGAGASTTATRNETVTFSMSLREATDYVLSHAPSSFCERANSLDLHSELDLRQAIQEALQPVSDGYLTSGHHKAPKAGGAAPSSTKAALAAAAVEPTPKGGTPIPRPILQAQQQLQNDLDKITSYEITDAGGKQDPNTGSKPNIIAYVDKTLGRIIDHAIFEARALEAKILGFMSTLSPNDPTRAKLNTLLQQTKAAEDSLLPLQLDPPLDTIAHQVQFIIVFNANATPTWTLVKFKGPGPASGSFASVTKTLTHTLTFVMGPPSSPDASSTLNALQIGTAIGNTLGPGVTVP